MSREIIDVSESREGFRIVFESGDTRYCTRFGGCELLGHSGDFFVIEDCDYYLVLDPDGDIQGRIQTISGRVSSITSNSVVIRDGQYLKSYDPYGNLKSTRQVF